MTTSDFIINRHNHLMATPSTNPGENRRRRLPKITKHEPIGVSSDETPRPTTGDESARQRRRTQQRQNRQPTPDGREKVSPSAPKGPTTPPRSGAKDEHPPTKRHRGRRRVQSSSQIEHEPSLLQGFEDEIVIERHKKSDDTILPDLIMTSPYAGATPSTSAPTPRIYYENRKAFASEKKETAEARIVGRPAQSSLKGGYGEKYTFQQQTAEILKRYTVQVAKQTHAGIQKLFLFIHGINAGYALWICVIAFVFTQSNATEFFNAYRSIALITHLLFYLFLALCMVDVLDRVDPAKMNKDILLRSVTAQNSAIAFLFYTIAMVVNLVMMQSEDYLRMNLYSSNYTNITHFATNNTLTDDGNTWRNLTAVRAAFILVGWIVVSIHVKSDRLRMMIQQTEDRAFYEDLQNEQPTTPLVSA